MDQNVAEAIYTQLANELLGLQVQRALMEVKIDDATVKTGNPGADEQLRTQAQMAQNTIAMIDRQIEVRQAKVQELEAQLGKQKE